MGQLGARAWSLGLVLWGSAAVGRAADTQLPDPATADSHLAHAARVGEVRERAVAEMVARYTAHLGRHPDDVGAAVELCKLHSALVSEEEEGEVSGAYEACLTRLSRDFPESPTALLFRLENSWGEEAVTLAAEIRGNNSLSLALPEEARLHRRLAQIHASEGRTAEAAAAGRRAMELDPSLDLSRIVAEQLIDEGKKSEAAALLWNKRDEGPPFEKTLKLRSLVEAGAYDKAHELLQAVRGAHQEMFVDPLLQGEILEGVGDTAAARLHYTAASGAWNRRQVLERLFDLDLRGDDPSAAHASYDALRDLGWDADPLGRRRLALSWRFPGAAWQARDLLGVLGLLLLLGCVAFAPVLLVVPVHYASLWRRSRAVERPTPTGEPITEPAPSLPPAAVARRVVRAPDLEPVWGLGHLWIAAALFLTGEVLAFYFFAYEEMATWVSDLAAQQADVSTGAQAAFGLTSMAAGFCIVPLFVGRGDYLRILGPGRWSRGEALRAALGGYGWVLVAGLAYRVVSRVFGLSPLGSDPVGVGMTTDSIIAAIGTVYGTQLLFLVVAIVVPIAEEFLFRSVLLDAYGRHMRFSRANMLQAGLFALAHDAPAAMPVIVVIGLVCGELRRRSGGLLAPIALHGINNGIYVLVLIATGRVG